MNIKYLNGYIHILTVHHDIPTMDVNQPIKMQHLVLVTMNNRNPVIFVRAVNVLDQWDQWATCTAVPVVSPAVLAVLPAVQAILFSAYTVYIL